MHCHAASTARAAGLAQEGFELCEDLFDRVEIGTVRRQEEKSGSGLEDGLAHRLALVRPEIVHDDDLAWRVRRGQNLLDIGEEAFAIDRPPNHAWGGNAVMAQGGQETQRPPASVRQIRLERKAYYSILETTQKGDLDITNWLTWFLACLGRAIEGADTILAGVLKKARFWEARAGNALNERQCDMLNRLLDGFEGKLTSSKWAMIEKCSPDTALRDISDLLERGILIKDQGGGHSTSYSLADVS
jgi:hypothetical protein